MTPESIILPGKMAVIVGGQYGSEAKGSFAAFVARHNRLNIVVSNAGPNSGHTAIFGDRKIVARQLPIAGILQPQTLIYLCAGAIIDPVVLKKEMEEFKVSPTRIRVHPNAAVVNEWQRDQEHDLVRIGSTRQGTGAALSWKLKREEDAVASNDPFLRDMCEPVDLRSRLFIGDRALMEVPQGFSLGINERFYPYCTSRQCTVQQALSDAQVPVSQLGAVIMALRTFPIRVGSPLGGYSGDFYPDQNEMTWDDLKVDPEITTVTKRIRRVFTFSMQQFADAYHQNEPNVIFMSHMDYWPQYSEQVLANVVDWVRLRRHDLSVATSDGPRLEDIKWIGAMKTWSE